MIGLVSSALETIARLRPISFTWNELWEERYGKTPDPGLKYGFVAQEMQQVTPEFITEDPDGYLWYNPSGFEAILTAAIQELKTETEQQQVQIEQLEKELEEMRIYLNKVIDQLPDSG